MSQTRVAGAPKGRPQDNSYARLMAQAREQGGEPQIAQAEKQLVSHNPIQVNKVQETYSRLPDQKIDVNRLDIFSTKVHEGLSYISYFLQQEKQKVITQDHIQVTTLKQFLEFEKFLFEKMVILVEQTRNVSKKELHGFAEVRERITQLLLGFARDTEFFLNISHTHVTTEQLPSFIEQIIHAQTRKFSLLTKPFGRIRKSLEYFSNRLSQIISQIIGRLIPLTQKMFSLSRYARTKLALKNQEHSLKQISVLRNKYVFPSIEFVQEIKQREENFFETKYKEDLYIQRQLARYKQALPKVTHAYYQTEKYHQDFTRVFKQIHEGLMGSIITIYEDIHFGVDLHPIRGSSEQIYKANHHKFTKDINEVSRILGLDRNRRNEFMAVYKEADELIDLFDDYLKKNILPKTHGGSEAAHFNATMVQEGKNPLPFMLRLKKSMYYQGLDGQQKYIWEELITHLAEFFTKTNNLLDETYRYKRSVASYIKRDPLIINISQKLISSTSN